MRGIPAGGEPPGPVNPPSVSIVIAAYNAGRTLGATLESALAQTHRRREIIFVDDGSTDQTEEALAPFRSRIRVIHRQHAGLAAARNAGVALAEGDYLALLDADDLWTPDKLSVQLAVANRVPEAGLIACDGIEFHEDRVLRRGLLVGPLAARLAASRLDLVSGSFHRQMLLGNPISCPAQVLIPRRVVEITGAFGDFAGQDYDYYLRIAQRFPVALHRDSLARWRYQPEGLSGPLAGRTLSWDRMELPVLMAHRRRCAGDERRVLERRARRLIRRLARDAYRRGLQGERAAAQRELARLLTADPWRPTALKYWAKLRLQASFRSAAEKTRRALGGVGTR
jgi:glycosyltransferase involved in cell wall biosynthesis